jgi:hypothetical protein
MSESITLKRRVTKETTRGPIVAALLDLAGELGPSPRETLVWGLQFDDPDRTKAEETLDLAKSLGLVEEDGGLIRTRADTAEARRLLRDCIFSPGPDGLPGLEAAFYCWMIRNEEELLREGPIRLAYLCVDFNRAHAGGDSTKFNEAKMNTTQAWIEYCGLGFDAGKAQGFVPDPTAALLEVVDRMQPGVQRAGAFVEAVAEHMPVLDRGACFRAVLGEGAEVGRLTRALSRSLWRLDSLSRLRLMPAADAPQAERLAGIAGRPTRISSIEVLAP